MIRSSILRIFSYRRTYPWNRSVDADRSLAPLTNCCVARYTGGRALKSKKESNDIIAVLSNKKKKESKDMYIKNTSCKTCLLTAYI